jgi:hypothetical protein
LQKQQLRQEQHKQQPKQLPVNLLTSIFLPQVCQILITLLYNAFQGSEREYISYFF